MNLDEAFEMLKKAVSLAPRDGYIVDSLGWAYYRLGKMDDAVRELEKAVLLRPADPTINDHLGDAYWRTGRKLEAEFQWNHARDILLRKKEDEGLDDSETEELAKVLAKLKDGMPEPAKAEGERPKSNGGG
jgi:tetratricopeptide (TPR) repeat protein